MQKILSFTNYIYVFFSTVIFFYFLFYYPFGFYSELDNNRQYLVALIAIAGWFLFLLIAVFSGSNLTVKFILLLLVANVLLLYMLLNPFYSFANEYFTCITAVVLPAIMLSAVPVNVLSIVFVIYGFALLSQLCLAFGQMHGFSFHITQLNIQGSLQNSGPFTCFLVILLPVVYFLCFHTQNTFLRETTRRIIFGTILSFMLFIIWRSYSRTALMALVVLLVVFLHRQYGQVVKRSVRRISGTLVFTVSVLLIIGLGWMAHYLFYLKRLSALGRVLKLDVAAGHITDKFWWGTGIGRFAWYYPQWQAGYFAMHPHPPKDYFLSAGESFLLFSEYIQLFETVGLWGSIVFILLMIWFFKTRSSGHKHMLTAVKLSMLVILVACLTSYPFHVNAMLMILSYSLVVAARVGEPAKKTWYPTFVSYINSRKATLAGAKVIFSISLLVAACALYLAFMLWDAKRNWDKLHSRPEISVNEKRNGYNRLSYLLKNDGKFLTDYGIFLSTDPVHEVQQSIGVLEEAKKYFISRVTIEALGQACIKAGNYRKAIPCYEWLCNYLPNKFDLKLQLLQLYAQVQDTPNAVKTAHTMLTMPVKFPSPEVDSMKRDAATILKCIQLKDTGRANTSSACAPW